MPFISKKNGNLGIAQLLTLQIQYERYPVWNFTTCCSFNYQKLRAYYTSDEERRAMFPTAWKARTWSDFLTTLRSTRNHSFVAWSDMVSAKVAPNC